jgi:aminoglycoside 2''-phosphotransferase
VGLGRNRRLKRPPEHFVDQLAAIDLGIEIDSWTDLGSGQNNHSLLINEEWVIRFPLHNEAASSIDTEVEILQAIQGRFPVPTPNPEIVIYDSAYAYPIVGYRAIAGRALSRDQLSAFDSKAFALFGRNLGRFLSTLHGTPLHQFSKSLDRDRDSLPHWTAMIDDAARYLKPRLEIGRWNRVNRKLGKSIKRIARFEYEPALRHDDFGFGNFLFDEQDRLSGVIDFGSAGLGDPAVDIAGLTATNGPGEKLVDRVRTSYPAIDDLLERARVYRATFPLQHALLGAKGDDEDAVREGLESYLDD